nr:thioredoxin domain-containing protein [uncultured Rhodopila sp.]
MSGQVEPVNDQDFEQHVLRSDVPVIVYFSAERSGPCEALKPTLLQAADEYDGRVKFVELDIDENNQTARRYGISAAPDLMMVIDGSVEGHKAGLMSRGQMTTWIEANIW